MRGLPDGTLARLEPRPPVTDHQEPFVPRTEGLSRAASIQTVPFDEHAVALVGEYLGVDATKAPFQMPGSNVWQLTIPGTDARPQVLLTLWPGLKRVDAIAGPATIVLSNVVSVDLVPGVEVQFRRGNRDVLVIARNGKVIVRA
jgi:hypothetical protein